MRDVHGSSSYMLFIERSIRRGVIQTYMDVNRATLYQECSMLVSRRLNWKSFDESLVNASLESGNSINMHLLISCFNYS